MTTPLSVPAPTDLLPDRIARKRHLRSLRFYDQALDPLSQRTDHFSITSTQRIETRHPSSVIALNYRDLTSKGPPARYPRAA
jgi:hypothetical protein